MANNPAPEGRPNLAQRRGPQHVCFWRDGVERLSAGESSIDDSSHGGTTEFSCTRVLPYVDLAVPRFFPSTPFCSTTAARGTFSRPYTKKKNAASTRKNNVNPNIFASYLHTEVICFAGNNANAIPSAVVTKPQNPDTISVPRP